MGFSKGNYEPGFRVEVTHAWHPGTTFAFTFPKTLPQPAIDAETRFLGLGEKARDDEHRLALIELVAQLATSEPEGFDDFPGSAEAAELAALSLEEATPGAKPDADRSARINELAQRLEEIRAEPLAQRFRAYFDDPSKPELEQILVAAWRANRASVIPTAYTKSLPHSRARDSHASGATA